LERLRSVIDPGVGVDVVSLRLIEDLTVDGAGVARYKFHPSSPLCPVAIPLALSIREAVAEVAGVTGQEIEVVGYMRAEELNAALREAAGG
jgi:metal-sulfur cluster biosynthetic enzyme